MSDTQPRFVLDEARIAIHDTQRDGYYPVISVKTARLFTHHFNQPGHSDYAYIVNDDSEWLTADDERLNDGQESDDSMWLIGVALGYLTDEEIAIGNGQEN